MADPRARILVPGRGTLQGQSLNLTIDSTSRLSSTEFPAKEYVISDDVLNVADTATVSIANEDGVHTDKFVLGQMVRIDESDSDVANGQWTRQFTGRITTIEDYTDIQGGTNILLTAMDLGWHLTSCHARPLLNLRKLTIEGLIQQLIDPTWGFGTVTSDATMNTNLKHGRRVIQQNINPQLRAVLPFIQVEIGQAPWDILRPYAERAGLLINVGARGEIIFFRPTYTAPAQYTVEFHGSREAQRARNNVVGRPAVREGIDELYSEIQCWSTAVIPPKVGDTTNPNEQYRKTTYKPDSNPLPFQRLHAFMDGEAINQDLRRNRAIRKQQMGDFASWTYEAEFPSHSQNGGFFVSNRMVSVNDSVRKLSGAYYVQAVRRSVTLRDGAKSRLTIRKPLLNPELGELNYGAGAKSATTRRTGT